MRSIKARLTAYYALATTLTAALLFFTGYSLLKSRLIEGLDRLNAAEFQQLKARLGSDYAILSPKVVDQRIRETADAASALFFINVDVPRSGIVFYSHNLRARPIPDVKGRLVYSTEMEGIGELRAGEFIMKPFDVTIATPMSQVREGMRGYVEVCAALLLTMLVASVAIGMGLSRVILRPLIFIRETASRIGSDNLGERIPVPANRDELTDLAQLLNRMFDRLETSFGQIKRFAADASHELKTPLSLIRLHGEKLLQDGALPPGAIDAVIVQLDEVARLNRIIDEMLFLSRAEAQAMQLELQPHSAACLLDSFGQDATVLAEHRGLRFGLRIDGDALAAFDERWLRQVWLNLLTNALTASSPGGAVMMHSLTTGETWRVTIEDEGPGLKPDQLARVFDRFTQFGSAEQRARGSGLGLAICRSIVTLHGGTIAAANRLDRSGLRVTVMLPRVASPA